MDLLGEAPALNLNDPESRIFSRNFARPPQYMGENAVVRNSLLSEGCRIDGTVENSVLFGGVTVEEGAYIRDAVIMEDTFVGRDAQVSYAIVDSGAHIACGATVGESRGSRSKIAVIPKGAAVLSENAKEQEKKG